jgi:hypothetical protein
MGCSEGRMRQSCGAGTATCYSCSLWEDGPSKTVDKKQAEFMKPENEAIREIDKARQLTADWFKVLARRCDHRISRSCGRTPFVNCALQQCPLLSKVDILCNDGGCVTTTRWEVP